MRSFLLLLCLTLSASQLRAETVYVQDQIFVPLRGGASDHHRIIHRGLRSGTPLELLSEDKETGFSLVRMENGTEGWIRSQYISPRLIARDQLKLSNQRLTELETENSNLKQTIDQLRSKTNELAGENSNLTQHTATVQTELDKFTRLAANTVNIDQENKHLHERNQLLRVELDVLTQANADLMNLRGSEWLAVKMVPSSSRSIFVISSVRLGSLQNHQNPNG